MGEMPEEQHRDMGGLKNQVFSLWHRNMGGNGIEIWESPCGIRIPIYGVETILRIEGGSRRSLPAGRKRQGEGMVWHKK